MAPRQAEAGGLVCCVCNRWKSLDNFHRKRAGSETRRSTCKECQHAATRTSSYVSRHGMTQEEVAALAAAQGGCAICGTSEPAKGAWHVDHDHSCEPCTKRRGSCDKCRRGVLCSNCNTAIGLFRDDPTVIDAALQYLLRTA